MVDDEVMNEAEILVDADVEQENIADVEEENIDEILVDADVEEENIVVIQGKSYVI